MRREGASFKISIYAILVIIITIISFLLRLINIDNNSLWEDEIATAQFIQQDLLGIWNVMLTDTRPTPPLFYLMEHFMVKLGDSEFILRLLPAIFGSLTIPLVYLVGKEFTGKVGGIFAASLLATSVFHIYYSQEARAYTLLLFLFVIALLFYLYAIRTNERKYWIVFAVVSALSFWCHFYILIGIAVLVLHLFIVKGKEILNEKKLRTSLILAGCLFLILISPLIIVGLSIISHQLGPIQPGLTGIFTAPYAIYKMLTWNFTTITLCNCIIAGVYLLFALAGIFCIWKLSKGKAMLIGMGILLPPTISVILSIEFGLAIWQQYLIYVLPFIYIAISGITYLIPKKEENVKKISIILVAAIITLSVAYLPLYYTNYTKSDWRGASDYLTEVTEDGDTVIIFSSQLNYYYNPDSDMTRVRSVGSVQDLEVVSDCTTSGSIYYIFTWDILPKNITETAPSGSEYLDNLIASYYANTELGKPSDPEIIQWLSTNSIECATFMYFGPYRDIHIHKYNPQGTGYKK